MQAAQARRSDPAALLAFGALVVLVGSNVVAIRFSNRELAPMWGAGVRFAIASVIFWLVVAVKGLPIPTGAALAGASLYGLLGFGAFFVVALVPLLTMLLAVAQGLERLNWRAVGGGVIALTGRWRHWFASG